MTEPDPPQNLAAEQSILGLMITSAKAVHLARRVITPLEFYRPAHATIFGACTDLVERNAAIDPVSVMDELTRTRELARVGGGTYLHTLMALPASPALLSHYAEQVRAACRRRSVIVAAKRILQSAYESPDMDDVMTLVARETVALGMLLDEGVMAGEIKDLSTMGEFLARPDRSDSWVVPQLFERQDVWMFLGGEGGGKSYLSRQFCLAIAHGVHPFRPQAHIPPAPTLLIDLENGESMLRRQARYIEHRVLNARGVREGQSAPMHIWHRVDGINLRDPHDALELERVLAQTQPAFVCLGSLYNSFERKRDDWDTAAEEVKVVLNRMRKKFDCCFVIEHHMPKGDGSTRPGTPFGSSVWQRWVSMGRVITQVGDNTWELTSSFREDRDERAVPLGLCRNGELPWTAIWDAEELKAGRWPDKTKSKAAFG